ncbi:hypothetical protein [Luteolibacter soli]|uniref:EF-hand domain-containing protein n=1 Tax=Luteolibacter soli TaxID=3135280 RepID=A0ABU9ASN9_9BACT
MKFTLLPLLIIALSSATASAGLISPTKAEVKKFDKADTDNDEVISRTEFAALLKTLTKAKNGGQGNVADLQAVADAFFDYFDNDHDNSIDLFEWFVARTSLPSDPQLPDIVTFPGLDLNGDEFVKAGEFVKVLKDILPTKFVVTWFKSLSVN